MKNLIVMWAAAFCLISFSSFGVKADKFAEEPVLNQSDYDELTALLFDQKDVLEILCSQLTERVIIMNIDGACIREDCIENDDLQSSNTLTPLIQRSNLIMKIDKISYYLLD